MPINNPKKFWETICILSEQKAITALGPAIKPHSYGFYLDNTRLIDENQIENVRYILIVEYLCPNKEHNSTCPIYESRWIVHKYYKDIDGNTIKSCLPVKISTNNFLAGLVKLSKFSKARIIFEGQEYILN